MTEEKVLADLRSFSSFVGWKACCSVSDEDIPRMIAELEHFDFGSMLEAPWYFGEFLAWLYKLVFLFVTLNGFRLTTGRAIDPTHLSV